MGDADDPAHLGPSRPAGAGGRRRDRDRDRRHRPERAVLGPRPAPRPGPGTQGHLRMSRSEHLVAVAELSSSVRLLDVRWHLGDAPGEGRRRYASGHLPGARFLDLEEVLTAHTGDPRDGRHPLPEVATLTVGLEALGV